MWAVPCDVYDLEPGPRYENQEPVLACREIVSFHGLPLPMFVAEELWTNLALGIFPPLQHDSLVELSLLRRCPQSSPRERAAGIKCCIASGVHQPDAYHCFQVSPNYAFWTIIGGNRGDTNSSLFNFDGGWRLWLALAR